jgi:beta-glucosidase-like glycosyl hydrolase/CubicO group peptidase (beta-lactamase class C family)
MRRLLILLVLCCIVFPARIQGQHLRTKHELWADTMLQRMSLREMAAQMMMVAAWSNKDETHVAQIEELIHREHIGGLIFFQGTAAKQVWLTNYYQQISKTPMLIGIDGEWGLAMRLKDLERYPYAMTMGAAGSEGLAFRTGAAMGRECRRIGVHINFAPVVDVNTNPANPIIGFRSFGERADQVQRLANALIRGMQSEGVMACAKHFPGHGDTETDSHQDLPFLGFDRKRLDSLELAPFRATIEQDVASVMVGHLEVPALDTTPNRPASLSKKVVEDLLRTELGFEGLIITDALNMKGVKRYFPPGYAEYEAFMAGNDILLFPENVPLALDLIEQAVDSGLVDSMVVVEHARRILSAKSRQGLDHYQPAITSHLDLSFNFNNHGQFLEEAANKGITLVSDFDQLIPLNANNPFRMASLAVGKSDYYRFQDELNRYHKTDRFLADRNDGFGSFKSMEDTLAGYDLVVLSLHDAGLWGKKAVQVPQPLLQSILSLNERTRLIVVNFGNLYQFGQMATINNAISAFEDHPAFHSHTAAALFGIEPFAGHLPAAVSATWRPGTGIATAGKLHPKIPAASPGARKPDSLIVRKIDAMLQRITASGAAPGGQLLVVHKGYKVLERNFGNFDYSGNRPVGGDDLYDIASITKTAATTLAFMKLYEEGKLRLNDRIEQYLPEFDSSNKKGITLEQLLLHEAGLQAWIPFYQDLLTHPENILDQSHAGCGCLQVAEGLYMDSAYLQVIRRSIIESPVQERGHYTYSDLGMILLQRVIEQVSGERLNDYVHRHFYEPMGLQRISYLPLQKFDRNMIAPTANDQSFRKQVLRGYVHDPAAAMMGGVSGHAGVFSNASDLAAVYLMLLNGGYYNGARFLKTETVARFTRKQKNTSRRGLGFDKPETNPRLSNPASSYCSPESFGHTGFTGTSVWADPKQQLIFVFLSNRVYPDEGNNSLAKNNFRTELQRLVYEAME